MSFPKKGKFFPPGSRDAGEGSADGDGNFAAEIAAALHRSLGSTRSGVKTAAVWTGANEKTVKNWFSGRYGPSGEHLVALARHSDEVLAAFLIMAGRDVLMAVTRLAATEQAILDLLAAVRRLRDGEVQ